jgi:hypothetical protein
MAQALPLGSHLAAEEVVRHQTKPWEALKMNYIILYCS